MNCLWIAFAVAGEPVVPVVGDVGEGVGLDATAIVGDPAGTGIHDEILDAETKRVASLLRCPTCQGMSVYDSPAEGARAMRDEVGRMLEKGFSGQQVLDYFRAGYGEFILLQPRREGANWWLWAGPGLLAVAGATTVALRLSRGKSPSSAAVQTETDALRARVEREVAE